MPVSTVNAVTPSPDDRYKQQTLTQQQNSADDINWVSHQNVRFINIQFFFCNKFLPPLPMPLLSSCLSLISLHYIRLKNNYNKRKITRWCIQRRTNSKKWEKDRESVCLFVFVHVLILDDDFFIIKTNEMKSQMWWEMEEITRRPTVKERHLIVDDWLWLLNNNKTYFWLPLTPPPPTITLFRQGCCYCKFLK